MKGLFLDADAIFFDFDGVIADSHNVKTRAFAALYERDHPQIVRDVIAYHEANGGISRFRKFEHFEGELLGAPPTPERMEELGRRFAAAVIEAVVASPEVPGARALLQALKAAAKPCHVASGTPQEELVEIVARRALTDFFDQVRGSPAEKEEILSGVCEARGHEIARCLMIGDAMSDHKAAAAVGMPFLGVVQAGANSPFPAGTPVVAEFWSVAEALR